MNIHYNDHISKNGPKKSSVSLFILVLTTTEMGLMIRNMHISVPWSPWSAKNFCLKFLTYSQHARWTHSVPKYASKRGVMQMKLIIYLPILIICSYLWYQIKAKTFLFIIEWIYANYLICIFMNIQDSYHVL